MNFVVLFFSNILDTNHKHSSVTQKLTDISKRAFIISGIGLNSHLRNSHACFVHEIGKGIRAFWWVSNKLDKNNDS